MAGELLELPGGVYAMALNLEQDNIGCVLLGSDKNLKKEIQLKELVESLKFQ